MQSKLSGKSFDLNQEIGTGELSLLLGLTEQRIIQLVKQGLPRLARGAYPLRGAVGFYLDFLRKQIKTNQDETITGERLRLVRAQAKKAEIEAETAAGNILMASQAIEQTQVLMQALKSSLLSLPGRLSSDLVGRQPVEIREILEVALVAALNETAQELGRLGVKK